MSWGSPCLLSFNQLVYKEIPIVFLRFPSFFMCLHAYSCVPVEISHLLSGTNVFYYMYCSPAALFDLTTSSLGFSWHYILISLILFNFFLHIVGVT